MSTAAQIALVVSVALNVVLVAVLFVWAAVKDGQYDRATQRRLGTRRRTRLGPE
jgi:nitrogen fixation-related uncharacterized protein